MFGGKCSVTTEATVILSDTAVVALVDGSLGSEVHATNGVGHDWVAWLRQTLLCDEREEIVAGCHDLGISNFVIHLLASATGPHYLSLLERQEVLADIGLTQTKHLHNLSDSEGVGAQEVDYF